MIVFGGASVFGVSLLASDVNGSPVDGELMATTAADVVPGLSGVSVDEVVLNIRCIESISLSAFSSCAVDSQVLHILTCGIAITDESEHECALLIAPALILPVESNLYGWFAMELLPWIGRQVFWSIPVVLVYSSCLKAVGVGLLESIALDSVALTCLFGDILTDKGELMA